MTTIPKVSIFIPVYRGEKFIAELLQSFQRQSFTDFQLFIIDDASDDETGQIAASFAQKDARFIHIRAHRRLGPASSYRRGWFHCLYSPYMMMADAGLSSLDEGYLAECMDVLEQNSDMDICYGQGRLPDGSVIDDLLEAEDGNLLARYAALIKSPKRCLYYGLFRSNKFLTAYTRLETLGVPWRNVEVINEFTINRFFSECMVTFLEARTFGLKKPLMSLALEDIPEEPNQWVLMQNGISTVDIEIFLRRVQNGVEFSASHGDYTINNATIALTVREAKESMGQQLERSIRQAWALVNEGDFGDKRAPWIFGQHALIDNLLLSYIVDRLTCLKAYLPGLPLLNLVIAKGLQRLGRGDEALKAIDLELKNSPDSQVALNMKAELQS